LAASLLDDSQSVTEFYERRSQLTTKPLSTYDLERVAKAYFDLGDYKTAYDTYEILQTLNPKFLLPNTYEAMVMSAKYAGTTDDQIKYLKIALTGSRGDRKKIKYLSDLMSLYAYQKEARLLAEYADDYRALLKKNFYNEPLTKARYYETTAKTLAEFGYESVAADILSDMKTDKVVALRAKAEDHQQECDSGNAKACVQLAELYQKEDAFRVEKFSAASRACDLEDLKGCFLKATALFYGDGTEKDHAAANALFADGCDNKFGDSCHGLSLNYGKHSDSPDIDKAAEYWTKGCKYKSGQSCWHLGNYYRDKTDGDLDKAKKRARKYTIKACDFGYKTACYYYR